MGRVYDLLGVQFERIEYDVLPSPRLLSEGSRGPAVEAYCEGVWQPTPESKPRQVWRLRDDEYDPPQTTYKWVRVVVR